MSKLGVLKILSTVLTIVGAVVGVATNIVGNKLQSVEIQKSVAEEVTKQLTIQG